LLNCQCFVALLARALASALSRPDYQCGGSSFCCISSLLKMSIHANAVASIALAVMLTIAPLAEAVDYSRVPPDDRPAPTELPSHIDLDASKKIASLVERLATSEDDKFGEIGAEVRVTKVRHGNVLQVPTILQSQFAHGFCIHARDGLAKGSPMKLVPCTTDSTTEFMYDPLSKQIKAALDSALCVDARAGTNQSLTLQPCEQNVAHQEFMIGKSIKSEAGSDLCINADFSASQVAGSTSVGLGSCTAGDKRQEFEYISSQDALEELSKTSRHAVADAKPVLMEQKQRSALVDSSAKAALMRRGGQAQHKHLGETHKEELVAANTDIAALLNQLGEGSLVEDEDDDEFTDEDFHDSISSSMLERAVLKKGSPPPPPPPKINCVWGRWSKWDPCSADCAGGAQSRSRGEKAPAENGGTPCDGEFEEERDCNKQPCGAPPAAVTAAPVATTPPMPMKGGGAPRVLTVATAAVSTALFVAMVGV